MKMEGAINGDRKYVIIHARDVRAKVKAHGDTFFIGILFFVRSGSKVTERGYGGQV
jgi:hypothetical protein